MEHRNGKRLPFNIEVSLYQGDSPVVSCKTCNAGVSGMFIETGHQSYKKNTMLEVEFVVELSRRFRRFRRYRLPTMVAHSSKCGIGLMFLKSESEVAQAWQKLLQRNNFQPLATAKVVSGRKRRQLADDQADREALAVSQNI